MHSHVLSHAVTLIGEGFLTDTQCKSPRLNVTFTWYDSTTDAQLGTSMCSPIIKHNSTAIICQVSVGQGTPQVTLNVCGKTQLDLPRWPTDVFFWVRNQAWPTLLPWCTQMNNPPTNSRGWTWADNWWCSYSNRAQIAWQWSTPGDPAGAAAAYQGSLHSGGPVPGYRCTHIYEPAEVGYWDSSYLCVPSASPYYLTYSATGPISGMACQQLREGSDPYWSNGQHNLCARERCLLVASLTDLRVSQRLALRTMAMTTFCITTRRRPSQASRRPTPMCKATSPSRFAAAASVSR